MLDSSKRTIATLTAAACLGAAGWAVAANSGGSDAGAAATGSATQQTLAQPTAGTATNPYAQPPGGQAGQPPAGGPGASFPGETLLTGADAEKATAAATARLPGATVDRVETDVNDGGAYEAHVTRSDGTRATVVMDADFTVTSVVTR